MAMKRGQAFETMMLVISVIVAVAILGVLLGFLGNIGPSFGASAKTVIPELLKQASSAGFGTFSKENIDFSGDPIYVENMITGSSIPANKLKVCIATDINGEALTFTAGSAGAEEDGYITIKSAIKATVAVCKGRSADTMVVISDVAKTAAGCTPAKATAKTCPTGTG